MNDRIVLRSKIVIPENTSNIVSRARLRGILDGAIRKPIVLVVAPAGYGKTSMLASWAHQSSYNIGWYSITATDNHPDRFVHYFVQAFTKDSKLQEQCQQMNAETADENSLLSFMDTIIESLIVSSEEHILILDDFHHITDERILMCLEYFIYHMPPSAHLVISSRSRPDLALSKLRAYGCLDEIDYRELIFTPLEAKELFRRARRTISDEALKEALEVTEGWVVGLTLLASMRPLKGSIAFDRAGSFASLNEITDRFFLEEVLGTCDSDLQEFLLKTSLSECFSIELAIAATGLSEIEVADRLQKILDKNPFLFPMEGREGWFRYHSTLRKFLNRRLKTLDPEQAKASSLKISSWYTERGMSEKAVEVALESKDYETAEVLIVKNRAKLHENDRLEVLLSWIKKLPPHIVQKNPLLCIAKALPLGSVEGNLFEAENCLCRAEYLLSTESVCSEDDKNSLLGEIAANRTILAALSGNADRVHTYGHQALKLLSCEKEYLKKFVTQSLLWHSNKENVDLRKSFETTLEKSKEDGVPVLVFCAMSDLGNYDYRCGKINLAKRTLRDALDLIPLEHHTQYRILTVAYFTLGEIYYLTDQLSLAQEHLTKGLDICQKNYIPLEVASALMTLAKIECAQGFYDESARLLAESLEITPLGFILSYPSWSQVEKWMDSKGVLPFSFESDIAQEAYTIRGSMWARQDAPLYLKTLSFALSHRVDEACFLIEKNRSLIEKADEAARLHFMILYAALLEEVKRYRRAELVMEEALEIAQRENLTRPFIDEDARIKSILGRLKAYRHDEFTIKLYETCRANQSLAPETRSRQALSNRETEILVMSRNGISTAEIAKRLQLSRQTVRTHFANTYSKLEVHSRQQAVCAAEALGII